LCSSARRPFGFVFFFVQGRAFLLLPFFFFFFFSSCFLVA